MSRVMLVTGVAAGLGRAIALRGAARGDRVIGLDCVDAGDAEGEFARMHCDLRDVSAIRGAVADVICEHGRIDVLVNNAAMGTVTPLEHVDASFVSDLIAVNLTAPLELTRAVLPSMRARGKGRIVNVSSISCVASVPGTSAYAASKAGLEKASAILAAELAGSGVSVGVARLGRMQTESYVRVGETLRARLEDDSYAGYRPILDVLWGVIGNTELGMDPRDVAASILAFADSEARVATFAPLSERLQVGLSAFLPASVLNALLGAMGRRHRQSLPALAREV